jgi:hypothetical protein
MAMAFSSESMPRTRSGVGSGARKENAPKKITASVLIRSEPIRLEQKKKLRMRMMPAGNINGA